METLAARLFTMPRLTVVVEEWMKTEFVSLRIIHSLSAYLMQGEVVGCFGRLKRNV